jgi:hypothetical protein
MESIIIKNCANYTIEIIDGDMKITPKQTSNPLKYKWEVFNVNVGHTDDYIKMDKNTDMNEVKEKCIESGSMLFVTKDNCQYYIRSPPSHKKKRDTKSIKRIAEDMISRGKDDPKGFKSYVLVNKFDV